MSFRKRKIAVLHTIGAVMDSVFFGHFDRINHFNQEVLPRLALTFLHVEILLGAIKYDYNLVEG